MYSRAKKNFSLISLYTPFDGMKEGGRYMKCILLTIRKYFCLFQERPNVPRRGIGIYDLEICCHVPYLYHGAFVVSHENTFDQRCTVPKEAVWTQRCFICQGKPLVHSVRGVMVSMQAFQACVPGSIPGERMPQPFPACIFVKSVKKLQLGLRDD